jgi:ADP-ribosylglycohydrolase
MGANENIWRNGIWGLVVGDALGVPVEFTSRVERTADPVTGMRAYGTHNQPIGTWSDDSSMTLATIDSMKKLDKIDYKDIMDKFGDWCLYGEYTPFGDLFDIGSATTRAIVNYGRGAAPTSAGGNAENDNGNGSLMRILPFCLFLYERQKKVCTSEDECIYVIHEASSMTHRHPRSLIACGIYYFLVKAILDRPGTPLNRLQEGINNAYVYYRKDIQNLKELDHYHRLTDLKQFQNLSEAEIKSSGYVVDTLEAAVWCMMNSDSYADCVLKAVNLGDDTDTVAAVAGGLAGLFYGYDNIPVEWIDVIQKKDWIEGLLNDLFD